MLWTRLSALVVKELLAAFRDKKARFALIMPPLIQVFLFAFAATMEVTNVPVGVVNQDWGAQSEQLISRFERASAFSEIRRYDSQADARAAIDRQEVMVVVQIGQDFSRKIAARETPDVSVLLDGRKSNSAQIVNSYLNTIISQFGTETFAPDKLNADSRIVERAWYNPNRDYRNAMVPVLIATLPMTMVLMMVGMSVARERELGTFEQLLVSPLQPLEIVVGKAAPGLLVGLGQCVIISGIVILLFGIPLLGSAAMLFLSLTVFLVAVIGIALFISSLVSTQQQAMMGIMLVMMPAMMLSGFSSPVQNMPDWLQPLALTNPLTHMLVIVRGLFLRDMPFWLVAQRIWPMAVVGMVTMGLAAWMFQRKVQ
ncbi:ABC transporter permease subunit [Rhodoblastus acidophilus]|uniref:Transport permease protein n=1 Tax=Rhodoblastus acidophilus TaxID=1074 RepID=A0A6N8DNV7_RHOAC|nr:ABC transporter permease [Rhodoblastus acidophilus]MCW2274490.1 ABC-2 type transport system permease protein [Rhodoblastus acidophilus]MTV32272.1 ABC transporter permease subunit [Rhodoblastus acidophilus]